MLYQKERRFCAILHSVAQGDEENIATFYLMNITENRNVWGVTGPSLEQALPSLLNKELNIASDYFPTSHTKKSINAGTFIKTEKPNGYALATAKITDPKSWDLLKEGKIGPISVVIKSFHTICSRCKHLLKNEKEAHEHECIKAGEAYELVDSFVFERVDFVDVPAYPQAGTLQIGASHTATIHPLEYCAGVYESQSFEIRKQEEKKLPEELEKLKTENTTLKKKVKDLEAKLAKIKPAQDEAPKDEHGCLIGKETWNEEQKKCVPIPAPVKAPETPSPEVARLTKEIDEIKKERHTACLKATVDARFAAALCPTKEDEMLRLATFTDEYLKIMESDAKDVSTKLKTAQKALGPITKYDETEGDTLEAAKKAMRKRLNLPEPIVKEAS